MHPSQSVCEAGRAIGYPTTSRLISPSATHRSRNIGSHRTATAEPNWWFSSMSLTLLATLLSSYQAAEIQADTLTDCKLSMQASLPPQDSRILTSHHPISHKPHFIPPLHTKPSPRPPVRTDKQTRETSCHILYLPRRQHNRALYRLWAITAGQSPIVHYWLFVGRDV